MANIVFLQASVDIYSELSLEELGRQVALACFGGGEFVGLDEGIWDEVPAMRLDRCVLGLEVILGGRPGAFGYTLEVASKNPHGGKLSSDPKKSEESVCEFSLYLSSLVAGLPAVSVSVEKG